MRQLKALDLFCGAGGAGMGLQMAGFDVTGIDMAFQPRYPGKFIQGDALAADLSGFDFIWASPPCQQHSTLQALSGKQYACHIADIREKLRESGKPYIIENVPGAPLGNAVMLCGAMFGLKVYRHRFFESNYLSLTPAHKLHKITVGSHRGGNRGEVITVTGHNFLVGQARAAMGINWMTGKELAQAIPPAYSEFLGRQVGEAINAAL